MEKGIQKIVDKLVQSLDWESILTIHKAVKHGVGQGSEVIPGLKRKNYDENLGIKDLKHELKTILKYVIENDYQSFTYGNWIISWYNQQWNDDTVIETYSQEDEEIEFEIEMPNTKLEVVYAPQRICIMMDTGEGSTPSPSSDLDTLKVMLENALAEENYEMAQKIQDILKMAHKSEQI
jgi:hypothetical protein